MSLPWFAFKIGDYVRDTMRLSTEGHGAYLLLMLDYYATEEAPPDDDDVLAAIVKTPVEVWKGRLRRMLEPFFEVRDGRWHHGRIESEIAVANLRFATATAKGKKGVAARVAKYNHGPTTGKTTGEAPAKPQVDTLTLTSTSLKEREREEALPPKDALQEIGTSIPKDWNPEPEARTRALAAAFTDEQFGSEVRKFVAHKIQAGHVSNNWDASFDVWMERAIDHREKQAQKDRQKAPPRIEVNTTQNWDAACEQWRKIGRWPRDHGPDPQSPACKAPMDVRAKHGINERGEIVKASV